MQSPWGRPVLLPPAAVPAAGECQLWPVPIGPAEGWLELLDADERGQADRFRVTDARDVFVTSRAVQRLIGAHYLRTSPSAVQAIRDCDHCGAEDHGRPRLVGTALDYSVSHTRHWLVIAVVGSGRVGVDIEDLATTRAVDDIARGVLTTSESEIFAAVSAADRIGWFLRTWTRKEAVIKLTGHGLRTPLDQLAVTEPTLNSVPRWSGGPIHLYDIPAGDGQRAALAATQTISRTTIMRPYWPLGFRTSGGGCPGLLGFPDFVGG